MERLRNKSKVYVFIEWWLFLKPSLEFAFKRGILLKLEIGSIQNYNKLESMGCILSHSRGAMYNVDYDEVYNI